MSAKTNALGYRGAKHTCAEPECGRRFYDLNRAPNHCPYCGAVHNPPEASQPAVGWPSKARLAKQYKIVNVSTEPLADDSPALPDIDEVEEDAGAAEIPELEDEGEDAEGRFEAPMRDKGDA